MQSSTKFAFSPLQSVKALPGTVQGQLLPPNFGEGLSQYICFVFFPGPQFLLHLPNFSSYLQPPFTRRLQINHYHVLEYLRNRTKFSLNEKLIWLNIVPGHLHGLCIIAMVPLQKISFELSVSSLLQEQSFPGGIGFGLSQYLYFFCVPSFVPSPHSH